MYGNGADQGPMYGAALSQKQFDPHALQQIPQGIAKQPASGLLAQQIEEVSAQVAEVMKMSFEIRDRLIGSVPETQQAGNTANPMGGVGGVFGTASARLYVIREGLEQSKRALAKIMGEV